MIEQIENLALDAIERQLAAASVDYQRQERAIRFRNHAIGVSVAFEGLVQQSGQLVAPVELQVQIDGDAGDRFRVGVLGVGLTRQQALEAAVAEWHMLAALPILAALGAGVENRRFPPHPGRLANWMLHVGRAGIRGALPGDLQPGGPFFRALISAIQAAVARWEDPQPGELRSIFILAAMEGQRLEVQAARDGFLDPELTQTLAELAWPRTTDAYLYKQLFVLHGNDAAGTSE